MSTILIIGGYGAVGREAAAALTGRPGMTVIVAGRDPGRARPVPGTTAMRVDASDPAGLDRALEGVDTVLMCVESGNAVVARACLERGIGYVDVSASRHVLAEIQELDGLAVERGATAALSVGLVPGVTNLLARICAERSPARDLRIGALLGSGEHHGPAAIAWTLDGLGRSTARGRCASRRRTAIAPSTASRSPTSTRCPALSARPPRARGCAWAPVSPRV
nr:hypothetical protein GCM10020093_069010 [Planobispora longispora]